MKCKCIECLHPYHPSENVSFTHFAILLKFLLHFVSFYGKSLNIYVGEYVGAENESDSIDLESFQTISILLFHYPTELVHFQVELQHKIDDQ